MSDVTSQYPSVGGMVFEPGDEGFESAGRPWNLSIQHRPERIVVAGSNDDVLAAVSLARERQWPLAVQSTGHGIPHSLSGGLLLDVRNMDDVQIDPIAQTATFQAGAKWRAIVEAAHPYGLAALSGTAPTVGAVGYNLGGGLGLMMRQFGFAADSIFSAELVTADGRLITASPTEHSELFWALKGVGGNFGVVTSMTVRLYPVECVYNGMLVYPGERSREVLSEWRAWTGSLPDTVTSASMLVTVPPDPSLPEMLHGKKIVVVRATVADGSASEIDSLRSMLGEPMLDTFAVSSYRDAALSGLEPEDPLPAASASTLLRELSDSSVDKIAALAESDLPFIMIDIRHLGGVAAREPESPSAIRNRDANYLIATHGIAESPEVGKAIEEASEEAFTAMDEDLHPGLVINFISHGSTVEHMRRVFDQATFERLQAIKQSYDPMNLFRMNHNIPPVDAS